MTETVTTNTFAVSEVSPATKPLPELPYHEAVASFLCGTIESCSKYHGRLVANVVSHPLIAALHGAFASHRPVCLSPDIIWLTITQGLAIHINQNAEQLRRHFVSHDGKLKIVVRRDDFVKGSPENPWPEVFTEFSEAIRDYIGQTYALTVADFSTTGPVERAASEVALLDSMQSYFEYELHTLCGIPSITLEGTAKDWRSIADRVQRFSEFGLDWWVDPMRPVLQQFVDAASGTVDREYWESIYKYQGPKGSGSPHVSGWVGAFFPYLRSWDRRYVRNPSLSGTASGRLPGRDSFPNLPCKAPFKWMIGPPPFPATFEMEFIGGLIGVSQDSRTLGLRPEIGWAVREARSSAKPGTHAIEFHERNPFSVL